MADFIGRMRDGISKGVTTVSAGSKTMIEKTKLSNQIRNLENERTELLAAMGKSIYKFCKAYPDKDIPRDMVSETCAKIRVRSHEIVVLKEKLDELNKDMQIAMSGKPGVYCMSCGAENMNGSAFCSQCGTKL